MEEVLRKAIARRDELSLWGLQNLICAYTLKCRSTEQVITMTQQLKLKPDDKTEDELNKLKRLRRQTYKDIKEFINKRE